MAATHVRRVKDPTAVGASFPNCVEGNSSRSPVEHRRGVFHLGPFSPYAGVVRRRIGCSRGVMVSVDRAFFRAVKTCAVAGEGYKVGPLPGRGASSVSLTSPRQLYQSSTKRVCDINVSERRNCNGETLVRAYTYVGRGRRPSETIIAPGFIPEKMLRPARRPSSDIRVRFRVQARNRTRMGSGSRTGRFDPGMNPGAVQIVRPSAASSHKFVAHPYERGVASVSKLRTRSEARDELTMSVAAAGNDASP